MQWEMVAALTGFSGVLGLAIWRFAKMEAAVRHNSHCQRILVRMVDRLNYRFRKHVEETSGGEG